MFENLELKAQVTKETERYLADGGVFVSNTSTLPISLLAEAARLPENFIGNPILLAVGKMQLVEIIRGDKTRPAPPATALDYACPANSAR